jgi:general secretion pathway protein H
MKAFSRHRGRIDGGFTLLEVLVVVLIIGIIVTFAVLSLGNRALDDRLETEARRLQQLIALAAEESEIQGLDYGWSYTLDGYKFLGLDNSGQWVNLPGSTLRPRPLVDPLYLDLRVEGRAMGPSSIDNKTEEPQILLLSSGETTAFRLELRARDYKPFYRLEGDALGRFKFQRFEEEP